MSARSESPIELLMDKLGAEIAIHLKSYKPLTDKQRAIKRSRVENACDEMFHEGMRAWEPDWANRRGQDQASELVVLWDKPVPFKAGHRKYLMRSILGAGVWEDQVTHVWAFPFDQTSPPLLSQLPRYREHVIRCLEAADTRYVLSVGALPLTLWRGELRLSQVQGYSGVLDERWVIYPIANPAAVLRDPMLQGEWRLSLYNFMDMVNGREDSRLMRKCVYKECTDGVLMYDKDGIGWCTRHWKGGVKKGENRQASQRKKANKQNHDQLDI